MRIGNVPPVGWWHEALPECCLQDLHTMADHDLSGGKVSAITSIRYRPDVSGGNSNVAVVAQVREVRAAAACF